LILSHEEWQRRVPALVAECVNAWDLRLGEPYLAGAGGYVTRVARPDGTRGVLKLVFPHRESEHEADALECWDGDGAVRLLARDDQRSALLLEQVEPGVPLSEARVADPLGVFVDLLPRLWKPVGAPFRPLAEEATWWVSYLSDRWEQFGRPFERRLVDAALEFLAEFRATQRDQVLVHQDLHAENVLAARREPWLVIDPKPLRGEREFGLASIIRSFELGHGRDAVLRRLDRLTADLGLDRDRARGWTIGQTIAWSFDSRYLESHAETARWLLESG
jgi:streptomycin 6-kinase